MKILFFLIVFASAELISISLVPGQPMSNIKSTLMSAYLNYLYSPQSKDQIELRLNGRQIIGWTPIRNKQNILNALASINLNGLPFQTCIHSYFIDTAPAHSQLFLITDKDPCTPQSTTAARAKGVRIFPIGVGPNVSDETLVGLAGGDLPGIDYLHMSS